MIITTSLGHGQSLSSFMAAGAFGNMGANTLHDFLSDRISTLLGGIRPGIVAMTDAWGFSDTILNSCLGRYDGQAYDALMGQARAVAADTAADVRGYSEHIQYILHPERVASKL